MHTRISLALAALMGAPACGAPDEATEPRADRDIQEGAEPIGVTQQRWSPIGLGCGLFMFGATMIASEISPAIPGEISGGRS
ncbi:hypothetical protein BE17_40435 [Sorangium cellulosum]|uniref:Secreted protein n=1 Tax=Sorangium cellulosum TaxID=56 RepID=A0A150S033_SORCE|nr:hypothetical protein BE17_40435 [Sorangium cellulosum]